MKLIPFDPTVERRVPSRPKHAPIGNLASAAAPAPFFNRRRAGALDRTSLVDHAQGDIMGYQNSTPPCLGAGAGTPATPVVPIERVRRKAASPTSAPCARETAAEQEASPAGNAAGLPPGASFDEMLALYREGTKSLREPVKHIIERVAGAHGMLPAHITGDQRAKPFVRVRYAAIAEVRRIYPEKSLPWLGRQFNRDHTTILYALRKMGLHP